MRGREKRREKRSTRIALGLHWHLNEFLEYMLALPFFMTPTIRNAKDESWVLPISGLSEKPSGLFKFYS
jgi:hypothetical protein